MLDAQARAKVGSQVRTKPQASSLARVVRNALVIQDAVLVYAAVILAYWVRYGLHIGPADRGGIPFAHYQGVAVLLLGLMMASLALKGAYRKRLGMEMVDELTLICGAATTAIAVVVVVTFMLHQFEYSRAVIIYLWVSLIVLLALGRALYRSTAALCHRHGWGVRRVLVVGASDSGKMIMQSIRNRPDLGYEVVGFVDRRSAARVPDFGRFPRLGTLDDLPDLIASEDVHEIVMALPGSAHEQAWSIVSLCEGAGVGLKLVPDFFEMSLGRVQVDDISGIPLLDVRDSAAKHLGRGLKRSIDLLAGMFVLTLTLPIVGILALFIKLESDGPAFIKQERVGRHGRRFSCYKLRTMRKDADTMFSTIQAQNEAQGHIFKMRNDPRLTPLGRYIRRLSLDELPQIWNVVRGDMSLVGPRPPLPREVVKYEPWQMRRLETTPGITGIWQVSGRSNLSFDEMVMMDIMYLDNWSLALDIKILLRTVMAVLTARGAY